MAPHVCPWRSAYLFDNALRRLFHNPRKIVGPYLSEGMTAMDIGCGMGFFTLAMARMLGGEGRVIAVDLQPEMLDVLRRRAHRKGVVDRIRFHRCEAGQLGVTDEVDFALAFWMVHETPDARSFAAQVRACLKPSGKFLVTEPPAHVSRPRFQQTVDEIRAAGFQLCGQPRIRLSLSALFCAT